MSVYDKGTSAFICDLSQTPPKEKMFLVFVFKSDQEELISAASENQLYRPLSDAWKNNSFCKFPPRNKTTLAWWLSDKNIE